MSSPSVVSFLALLTVAVAVVDVAIISEAAVARGERYMLLGTNTNDATAAANIDWMGNDVGRGQFKAYDRPYRRSRISVHPSSSSSLIPFPRVGKRTVAVNGVHSSIIPFPRVGKRPTFTAGPGRSRSRSGYGISTWDQVDGIPSRYGFRDISPSSIVDDEGDNDDDVEFSSGRGFTNGGEVEIEDELRHLLSRR